MQVKICGLTRPADARVAARLGATQLGCVLVPGTPRCVTPEQAAIILGVAAPGVERMLVFRRCTPEEVLDAAARAGTGCVQLHGFAETDCQQLERAGLTVRRVVDVTRTKDLAATLARLPRPVHLDVGAGGAGRSFRWERLRGLDLEGVVVAGGITPGNVSRLVALGPGGIDVSSGVESEPGKKDAELLAGLFLNMGVKTPGEICS